MEAMCRKLRETDDGATALTLVRQTTEYNRGQVLRYPYRIARIQDPGRSSLRLEDCDVLDVCEILGIERMARCDDVIGDRRDTDQKIRRDEKDENGPTAAIYGPGTSHKHGLHDRHEREGSGARGLIIVDATGAKVGDKRIATLKIIRLTTASKEVRLRGAGRIKDLRC